MAERVVFDTNIWISGLLWRGKPHRCLLLARAKIIQHVYCQETMAELSQKLRQVFGFSENHIRAVLYDLRRISERVEITGELDTFPIVRRKDEAAHREYRTRRVILGSGQPFLNLPATQNGGFA